MKIQVDVPNAVNRTLFPFHRRKWHIFETVHGWKHFGFDEKQVSSWFTPNQAVV